MDMRWSVLKPHHALWVQAAYDSVTASEISESFRLCGIGPEEGDIADDVLSSGDERQRRETFMRVIGVKRPSFN